MHPALAWINGQKPASASSSLYHLVMCCNTIHRDNHLDCVARACSGHLDDKGRRRQAGPCQRFGCLSPDCPFHPSASWYRCSRDHILCTGWCHKRLAQNYQHDADATSAVQQGNRLQLSCYHCQHATIAASCTCWLASSTDYISLQFKAANACWLSLVPNIQLPASLVSIKGLQAV